jgi:hypothetical protein
MSNRPLQSELRTSEQQHQLKFIIHWNSQSHVIAVISSEQRDAVSESRWGFEGFEVGTTGVV